MPAGKRYQMTPTPIQGQVSGRKTGGTGMGMKAKKKKSGGKKY